MASCSQTRRARLGSVVSDAVEVIGCCPGSQPPRNHAGVNAGEQGQQAVLDRIADDASLVPAPEHEDAPASLYAQAASRGGQSGTDLLISRDSSSADPMLRGATALATRSASDFKPDPEVDPETDPETDPDQGPNPLASFRESQQRAAAGRLSTSERPMSQTASRKQQRGAHSSAEELRSQTDAKYTVLQQTTAATEGSADVRRDSGTQQGGQRLTGDNQSPAFHASGELRGSQPLTKAARQTDSTAGTQRGNQRRSEGSRKSAPLTEKQRSNQRLSEGDQQPDFYVGAQQLGVSGEAASGGATHRKAGTIDRSTAGKSAAASGSGASADVLTATTDPVEGLSGAGDIEWQPEAAAGKGGVNRMESSSTGRSAVKRNAISTSLARRSDGGDGGRAADLTGDASSEGQAPDAKAGLKAGAQSERDGRQRRSKANVQASAQVWWQSVPWASAALNPSCARLLPQILFLMQL